MRRARSSSGRAKPADAFYLVRLGFVKVSEQHPGGDLVLAYVPRGGYFGEIGLLEGGVRTATCTALDHVEVVRISGEDFRLMTERLPRDSGRVRAGRPGTPRAEPRPRAGDRLGRIERLPVAGPDGGPEPAGPRPREVHALRSVRARVRRRARRRHAPRPRGAALRQVSRRHLVPLVPRSALHGRLSGRLDPAPQLARSHHRRLVHRLRPVRQQLPVREHHAPSRSTSTVPIRNVPDGELPSTRKKATGCDLCLEHAEPSCVYACPHDAAHRVEPLTFFGTKFGLVPPLSAVAAAERGLGRPGGPGSIDATSR